MKNGIRGGLERKRVPSFPRDPQQPRRRPHPRVRGGKEEEDGTVVGWASIRRHPPAGAWTLAGIRHPRRSRAPPLLHTTKPSQARIHSYLLSSALPS